MHTLLWNNVLEKLSTILDHHRFETWINPLTPDPSSCSDCLILLAPNQFIADFLEHHYKKLVFSTVREFSSSINNVLFLHKPFVFDSKNSAFLNIPHSIDRKSVV